jgi:hypothetical protein
LCGVFFLFFVFVFSFLLLPLMSKSTPKKSKHTSKGAQEDNDDEVGERVTKRFQRSVEIEGYPLVWHSIVFSSLEGDVFVSPTSIQPETASSRGAENAGFRTLFRKLMLDSIRGMTLSITQLDCMLNIAQASNVVTQSIQTGRLHALAEVASQRNNNNNELNVINQIKEGYGQ